jgi:acyl carrier protein
MDLEKTFGVSIPDEQIHRINTVSDAAAIVRERQTIEPTTSRL